MLVDTLFDLDSVIDDYCGRTDEELVQLARTDKGAANALVLRYSQTAFYKALSFSAGRSDIDDLCQEGLIGLLKAIARFDPSLGYKFSTFADTCIANQIRDYLNKTWNRGISSHEAIDEDIAQTLVDDETPESVFLSREFLAEVIGAVRAELSDTERQVFRRCVEGMSYKEAAKELGMTEKAVDNAMQRARRKLRSFVKRNDNK